VGRAILPAPGFQLALAAQKAADSRIKRRFRGLAGKGTMTCLPELLWDSIEGSPSSSKPVFLDLLYVESHSTASSLLRHEVSEAFLRLSAARAWLRGAIAGGCAA
jgi:hypothetical protein